MHYGSHGETLHASHGFSWQSSLHPANRQPGQHATAALGSLPAHHVFSTLTGYETGTLQQLPRSRMDYLQQTYINMQLRNLEVKPLADAQKAVADKAFCSVWLDSSTVLVGTKCNSLLAVQPHTGTHALLQYPEQPLQRPGPDLLVASAGISCGQHALALSPSGRWMATGGQAPQEILLWQVVRGDQRPPEHQQHQQQECLPLDSLEAGRGSVSSRTALQPVQTLMGHADWVFDMAWLDDSCFASAGRDRAIKLWQVPQDAAAAAAAGSVQYAAAPGACHTSVRYHKDKVRCIKYEPQQQLLVSACVDGTLGFWTPELQLCGGCMLPCEVQGPQALLLHGKMVAIGALHSTELIDSRVSKPVAALAVGRRSKRQRAEAQQAPAHQQQPVPQQQQQQLAWRWQQAAGVQQQEQQRQQTAPGGIYQGNSSQLQRALGPEQQLQQGLYVGSDDGSWDRSYNEEDQQRHATQLLQFSLENNQQPIEQLSQGRLLTVLHMALWLDQEQLARRIQAVLPAEVYYAIYRSVETLKREQHVQDDMLAGPAAQAQHAAEMLQQQEQLGRKRLRAVEAAGATEAAAVQAEVVCSIAAGDCGVRSLSLHHHLLGIGTGDGQLHFHDMRRLSSYSAAHAVASHSAFPLPNTGTNSSSKLAAYDMSWVPDSWGQQLPARVGCLGMPGLDARFSQVLGSFGFIDEHPCQLAVYTHCWDPTGTQLFLGGGPLQLGYKGCAMALYST